MAGQLFLRQCIVVRVHEGILKYIYGECRSTVGHRLVVPIMGVRFSSFTQKYITVRSLTELEPLHTEQNDVSSNLTGRSNNKKNFAII